MRKKRHTHNKIAGLIGGSATNIPEIVYLPPALKGRPFSVVVYKSGNAPTVEDNIVRIQQQADPIGQLIAMLQGQPVISWVVDADGNVKERYETMSLHDRAEYLMKILDRLVPTGKKKTGPKPKEIDEKRWETTIANAMERTDGSADSE